MGRQHESVIDFMRQHGHHVEFARLACSFVSLASYRSIENAGPLCRGGVVPEIFRLMEVHNDDSVLMDSACEALWRLGDRGGAVFIRSADGEEKLLEAMHVHRENPFLQSNACNALQRLVEPGSPWLEQMCESARAAMAAHIGHSPIRRTADQLIKLCKQAEAELPELALSTTPSPSTARPQAGASSSLKEWLNAVDDEGYLIRYLGVLGKQFASPVDIIQAYCPQGGGLDPRFFDDIGVTRLGHRRLFEMWFRDNAKVVT